VVGWFKPDNEPAGFIKGLKLFDYPSDYLLLKTDFSSWR
jgi:hypothetical protein